MTKLLRKDLILQKFNLMIWVPMIAVMMVFYTSYDMPARVFLGFGAIMLAFFSVSGLAQEDKQKVMLLNRSLPVAPAQIVSAKYVGAWLAGVVGIGSFILFGGLAPWSHFAWGDLVAFRNLMVPIGVFAVGFSLLFPFTIRFGFMGLLILGVVLQVGGTVVLLLAAVFGGKDAIGAAINGIKHGLMALNTWAGPTGSPIILLVVFAGLNLGSYWLSKQLLLRRDL